MPVHSLLRAADELLRLESELLEPAVRGSAQRLHALLAPDFLEIGASGRTYTREQIVSSLAEETPVERRITGFSARELAVGLALATYRVDHAGGQASLRSSIWRREKGGWRLVFHQGTPLPA